MGGGVTEQGEDRPGERPAQAIAVSPAGVAPHAPGSATLTAPITLGLADGGASNGGVWLTAPQATRHRWEKCPHHAGDCPGCGEKVKDLATLLKEKPSRVPKAVALADPALARALDKLLDSADDEDQADLAVGGAHQMFKRLKRRLPAKVLDPGRRRARSLGEWLSWLIAPPPPAGTDARDVLERAMRAHLITKSCYAASAGLPLEGDAKDVGPAARKATAAFLVRLAEQIAKPG